MVINGLTLTILVSVTTLAKALQAGPVEYVNRTQDMRFEYLDSFTLFTLRNNLCEGTVIATRQGAFDLHMIGGDNIKFMMITDYQIPTCREFNWIGCPKDTLYCYFYDKQALVQKINSQEPLLPETPCDDEIYIYIFPEEQTEPALGLIYSKISNKVCVEKKLSYCVGQGYERCKNNIESNCGTAICIVDHQFFKGYCYDNLDEKTANELCNQNALWAISSSKDIDFQILQPPNKYNVLDFLLAVIVLAILFTCACSCYYKYRLKHDGFAPFSAPAMCPTFMFPLPNYMEADYASINNGMIPLRILKAAD
jgi:hypothetical protein